MFIQLAIDLDILQQGVKQWGKGDAAQNGNVTLSWPLTFKKVLVPIASKTENNGYCRFVGVKTVTTTQVTLNHEGGPSPLFAFAIGTV